MADRRPAIFEHQVDFSQRFDQAVPIRGFFGFGKQCFKIFGQLIDGRCDVFGFDLVERGNPGSF